MKVFLLNKLRLLVYISALLLFSCISRDSKLIKSEDGTRDLAQILTEGKLVAVTDFESVNYFIYKGEPMGYQYEMLVSLAKSLGVKLELISEENIEESLRMLENGEVDIVASSIGYYTKENYRYNTTIPYRNTKQVLIQRKVNNGSSEFADKLIRNHSELANKTIVVKAGSNSIPVLESISKHIDSKIIIIEKDLYETDQLIDLVSSGEIDYAVCEEEIARIQATIYSNIDIETSISSSQELSWAVSHTSPDLLRKIDNWLTLFSNTMDYKNIYWKYFNNPYMAVIKKSDFFYATKGKISSFDEQIKQESKKINWDWRLLASLIYQESRFNPYVTSESGAYGLMQFMPNTAEYMGIEHKSSPSIQLVMGVRYLRFLEKSMENIRIPEKEKMKFVLAAYNAGYGHIIDARNLARKFGKDPNTWDNNVGFFIQNKREFYKDSTVRYGYLRGSETHKYVNEILERYEHYKNIVKE
ncbi:MAG: transporter substrate-binding domain-containing protein [Tenuifilaceae bacterium]